MRKWGLPTYFVTGDWGLFCQVAAALTILIVRSCECRDPAMSALTEQYPVMNQAGSVIGAMKSTHQQSPDSATVLSTVGEPRFHLGAEIVTLPLAWIVAQTLKKGDPLAPREIGLTGGHI